MAGLFYASQPLMYAITPSFRRIRQPPAISRHERYFTPMYAFGASG
jgi:hypothetical protein